MKEPKGTKANPARSCRDLYLINKNIKDGWYWIDPDLGNANNAIQVWCDMLSGGETCIHPQANSASPQHYQKRDSESGWFSELSGGYQIRYVDDIQLSFLRLLYGKAHQKFSYICQNSVGWFDQKTKSHDHALSLLGDNEYEIETRTFSKSQVIRDGCKKRGSNSSTVFLYATEKTDRLPIIDFKPNDFGKADQQFGFEAGPVCFS